MKKTLLLASCLMGTLITANAQQVISFEASEGFVLGDVRTQNGWVVTTAGETFVENQNVVAVHATDGSNALQIAPDTAYPTQAQPVVGATSPTLTIEDAVYNISFDVFIEADEDDSTEGADFDFFSIATTQQLYTTRLRFRYDGTIYVLDSQEGEAATFYDTGFTWETGTQYTVTMDYNFDDEAINYYLNGELIYQGTVFGGTVVENIAFRNDNYEGTIAFVDNIRITPGAFLSTNNVASTQFSVYPNPATNVINVTNANNVVVNNVAIADINGRTVKTVKFDGVAEAQVNISDLASGVYMVTISSDKGTTTKKIVKN